MKGQMLHTHKQKFYTFKQIQSIQKKERPMALKTYVNPLLEQYVKHPKFDDNSWNISWCQHRALDVFHYWTVDSSTCENKKQKNKNRNLTKENSLEHNWLVMCGTNMHKNTDNTIKNLQRNWHLTIHQWPDQTQWGPSMIFVTKSYLLPI